MALDTKAKQESLNSTNQTVYTPNLCKLEFEPPENVEVTFGEMQIEWNNGIVFQQGDLFTTDDNINITVTRDCYLDIHGTLSLLNTSTIAGAVRIHVKLQGTNIRQGLRYVFVNPQNRSIQDLNNHRVKVLANQFLSFTINKANDDGSTIFASNSNENIACDLFMREVF